MRFKSNIYKIFGLLVLFMAFSVQVSSQSILHPGIVFDLRFSNGSNVLEMNYEDNRYEISGLNEFISYNRNTILSRRSHLAIIAFMREDQKENLYSVNRASVLGSVVRSYLKIRHGLNNSNFTFIIRTDKTASNLVKIEYRPYSVKPYENQDIFYTLKPSYKELIFALASYREIPFEAVKEENSFEVFNGEETQNIESGNIGSEDLERFEELLKRVKELESLGNKESGIVSQSQKPVDNSVNHSFQKNTEISVQAAAASSIQAAAASVQTEVKESAQTEVKESAQTEVKESVQTEGKKSAQTELKESVQAKTSKSSQKAIYSPVVALKTNLLGLAGLTPPAKITDPIFNISAEFFFANRFSIIAEGFKSPLADKTDANSEEWFKTSGLVVESRVYLGKAKTYKGFYGGIYGLFGDFDIRDLSVDEKGKTGSFTGAGLSIGYAIPLYKGLTLEAGLRAGYRGDKFDTYIVNEGSFYISESLTNSEFGLTSYNLNLTYRFGSYKRPGER